MYCDKCGNKISEGEKFCSKCGTQVKENEESNTVVQVSRNNDNTESATAFFCIGSVLTMLISGFLKLYKIDFYKYELTFTPFDFSKNIRKLVDLCEYNQGYEEDKSLKFLIGLSVFYYIMFALAAILAISCLLKINNTKGKIGVSYYKDVKSSILFMLCGNCGIIFLLKMINSALEEEVSNYWAEKLEVSIFGGTSIFYITMIIGIAGFVLATSGIKKCKNDMEQGTVEKYVAKLKELKNKK